MSNNYTIKLEVIEPDKKYRDNNNYITQLVNDSGYKEHLPYEKKIKKEEKKGEYYFHIKAFSYTNTIEIDISKDYNETAPETEFKKTSKEFKSFFIAYLEELREKDIILGDKWAFFENKNHTFAYGGNILIKDETKRQAALNSLIKTLNDENKNKKPLYYKMLVAIAIVTIPFIFFLLYDEWYGDKIVTQTIEKIKNTKPKHASVSFLEKTFPTIAEWQNNGANSTQKSIAKNIFEQSNIINIWNHVHQSNWDGGIESEERQRARERTILFDYFNNNKKVKQECERTEISNTNFEKFCQTFISKTKNKVFYWKTGDIKLSSDKSIEDVFTDYYVPLSKQSREFCFDERIKVANVDEFSSVPVLFKWNNDDSIINEKITNWILLIIKDENEENETKYILFKESTPVRIDKDDANIVMGNSQQPDNKSYTFYYIDDMKAEEAGLQEEHARSYTYQSLFNKENMKKYFPDEWLGNESNRITNRNDKLGFSENKEMLNYGIPDNNEENLCQTSNQGFAKNGEEYGYGLSSTDPIIASLMNNIVNNKTLQGVRAESSGLNETHINLTQSSFEQTNIKSVRPDNDKVLNLINSSEYLTYNSKDNIEEKIINNEKTQQLPITKDLYMVKKNTIHFLHNFKDKSVTLITDSGEKIQYDIDREGRGEMKILP